MPILLVLYMTLQEKIDEFGRENLIPIDFIKQQLFLCKARLSTCFYLGKGKSKRENYMLVFKKDTKFAKSEWDKTKPTQ